MTTENQPEINWRQNCLTGGPHDGRPERIWNLPLLYAATVLFSKNALKELVISRIYNDAMQIVNFDWEKENPSASTQFTQEWADLVKANAEQYYMSTLQHKVGEISLYYKEARFAEGMADAARRETEGKLNPFYEPLHSHDSINLLCRILGVSSDRRARR